MDEVVIGIILTLLGVVVLVFAFLLGRTDGADAVANHCDSYQKFEYKEVLYSCNKVQKDLK